MIVVGYILAAGVSVALVIFAFAYFLRGVDDEYEWMKRIEQLEDVLRSVLDADEPCAPSKAKCMVHYGDNIDGLCLHAWARTALNQPGDSDAE